VSYHPKVRSQTTHVMAVALKYIYALCFDALIFLLALAKLARLRTATSIHPFLRLLRRDGLIFFFAGFFAGASQAVVAIVGLKKLQEPYRREVIQDFAAFGTALRVIAATRLYANLADFPPSSARTSRATRPQTPGDFLQTQSAFLPTSPCRIPEMPLRCHLEMCLWLIVRNHRTRKRH
jgi:hypothetical protein